MAVKRYVNDEWITVSGLQGPVGETGPAGPTGVYRGNSAPADTSLLWVDLDDTNSFVPYSAPTIGSTEITSGSTITNVNGLTINSTTIPTSKTIVVTTDKLSVHAATSSAELAGVISDETGSGALVFANTPTLVTPALGVATATSINGTSIPSSKTLLATDSTVSDATTSTAARGVGYMGIPQSSAATTGSYTIVAADAGEHIYSTATRTVTIPANASVAFPVGTAITFIAATGTTVTIAINSDTLLLAGAGTTGSRTLAAFGMATAIKITSTSWIISGNGLT